MSIYSLPSPENQHYLDRYIRLITKYIGHQFIGITEDHHILPQSMDGPNTPRNIISVPFKLHYILHWCLWKAYDNRAMTTAFNLMSNRNGFRSARLYESLRTSFIKNFSGENNPMFGKTHTDESKEIISQRAKIGVINGEGIHGLSKSRKLEIATMGGYVSGKDNARLGRGMFGWDADKRKVNARNARMSLSPEERSAAGRKAALIGAEKRRQKKEAMLLASP